MKEYILITGASSGIGYEMAQQLAAKKFNLILVARSGFMLDRIKNKLSTKHNIEVISIQKDLSNPHNAMDLLHEIKSNAFTVSNLVNNAGFG